MDQSAPAPETAPDAGRAPTEHVALGWLDDDVFDARRAPAGPVSATASDAVATPDLLEQRPRRSPVRAGLRAVAPALAALVLVAAYVTATLLWPLSAVSPVVEEVAIDDLTAPASAVTWPTEGSAAVGVEGFDTTAASTTDAASMASITKIVTVLMILEQLPLAVGESGPEFSFTWTDRQTYWDYLSADESALNVPVDGTLTEYEMLQGILIGSAGNYVDYLVSSIWGTDAAFTAAAAEWLAAHDLSGITVADPTGIDAASTADPASLIELASIAMADPVVAEIVGTASVTLPGAGEVTNTNELLSDSAVVGIKTGTLSEAHNLLAAKEVTVGDTTLTVYATVLNQSSDEARDTETARLLTEVAAEASVLQTLAAGTIVGTITMPWGATSQIVTDSDASSILWNGATATVTSDLSVGDARDAGTDVGTVTVEGPLGEASTGVRLTVDIEDPDAWWRLTHPLQLFGILG
ncbi:MAG: D-alanyl-D-alanine carboxypeptidase [Microbacterium sp.]